MPTTRFERWWSNVRTTGDICPLRLGMQREQVRAVLDEPDATGGTSRKYLEASIWKYGSVEFHFDRASDGLQLIFVDSSDGVVSFCVGGIDAGFNDSSCVSCVKLDGSRIHDWVSFHDVFKESFGFPDFYGRNMDAWVDCMSYIDEPSAGMTSVHVEAGCVLTIEIDGVDSFADRCAEQYQALLECAAFVNWRRVRQGTPAILALAFNRSPSSIEP